MQTPLEYRESLIKQIQAIATDVYEMAPDLVGNTDMICDLEIHLQFPPNACPSIVLVREHIGKNVSTIL